MFWTNLLDWDHNRRLVLSLQVFWTLETEQLLPPEDAVDVFPAVRALPQLDETEGRGHGLKHDAVLTGSRRAKSWHRNLQPAANERLNDAERLGDQAAAHVAIQGQPESMLLWKHK